MNAIKLESSEKFKGNIETLRQKFEEFVTMHQNETNYSNTEGSLTWIIRGSIDFFNKLDTNFLGKNNNSGIPRMEADHFANNIYRLSNAIKYLSCLWGITIEENDELNFLLDIRTLIVHSGEQVSSLESLKLKGYKDSQLGRIFLVKEARAFPSPKKYRDMDYRLNIWNDKHDKKKQYNKSTVDHHIENESYLDIDIYLKSTDVRDIVLTHIEKFIDIGSKVKASNKINKLPPIKNKVMDKESDIINFNKTAELISKDLRGGYIKENGVGHWDGFGLKKLYEYSKENFDVTDEIRIIIKEKIHEVMSKYWDEYQNDKLTDDDLPELDIRTVFCDFTPDFEFNANLKGEKFFVHIAPFFNTKYRCDSTDDDYLERFIYVANNALGRKINDEQTIDDIVCDYFVQSILVRIDKEGNVYD